MRKILLFLAVLVFDFVSVARAQETVDSLDLDTFWEAVCAVNKNYTKYQADQSKFKRKCLIEFADILYNSSCYFPESDSAELAAVAWINRNLAGDRRAVNRIFVDSGAPNASVMPNGVVLVSESLMKMMDTEELAGILGHEIAHYKLRHAEVNYYATKKKERNNEIWAGVLGGLTAAVYGAGQGMSGQKVDQQVVQNMVYASRAIAAENAENWGFRYSRNQELEADLAAANLLDYIGVGRDKLISAFKKLQAYDRRMGIRPAVRKKDRKKDTHPTWDERIFILENYQTINDYLAARKK